MNNTLQQTTFWVRTVSTLSEYSDFVMLWFGTDLIDTSENKYQQIIEKLNQD